MKKLVMQMTLVTAAALGLAGCPFGTLTPFNTTGTYTGTWNTGEQGVEACPITLTLEQDMSASLIDRNRVTGTVTLDLSCLGVAELLVDALVDLDPIEVTGALLPNGAVELRSPDILDECPEGGCVRIALLSQGVDDDSDGGMDLLEGTWIGTIHVSPELVLPLTGDFATQFNEE
jgi:hypothetical protein